jgi:hypothetical protein
MKFCFGLLQISGVLQIAVDIIEQFTGYKTFELVELFDIGRSVLIESDKLDVLAIEPFAIQIDLLERNC